MSKNVLYPILVVFALLAIFYSFNDLFFESEYQNLETYGEMVTEVVDYPQCFEGYGEFDISISSIEEFSILNTSGTFTSTINNAGYNQLTLNGNGVACFLNAPSQAIISIQPYEKDSQSLLQVSFTDLFKGLIQVSFLIFNIILIIYIYLVVNGHVEDN